MSQHIIKRGIVIILLILAIYFIIFKNALSDLVRQLVNYNIYLSVVIIVVLGIISVLFSLWVAKFIREQSEAGKFAKSKRVFGVKQSTYGKSIASFFVLDAIWTTLLIILLIFLFLIWLVIKVLQFFI